MTEKRAVAMNERLTQKNGADTSVSSHERSESCIQGGQREYTIPFSSYWVFFEDEDNFHEGHEAAMFDPAVGYL